MHVLIRAAVAAEVFFTTALRSADLALVGGTVYAQPDSRPIDDAVIVIRGKRIDSVGPRASVGIPRGAQVIDCSGNFIAAGFWNSHVHIFTLAPLRTRFRRGRSGEPPGCAVQPLGNTTVFDIASVLDNLCPSAEWAEPSRPIGTYFRGRPGLHQSDSLSVVVSSLEEINGFIRDTVYQPVFLADTPRPAACQHISERLRLSQPSKWISHHGLDQIQDSDCGAAFGLDPKTEVLPELKLKYCDPLRISLHPESLDAVPLLFQAWSALAPLVATPIGDAVRCVATLAGVQFP